MSQASLLLSACSIIGAHVGAVHAQDHPYRGKTIRVIVGFPSGGGFRAFTRQGKLTVFTNRSIPGTRFGRNGTWDCFVSSTRPASTSSSMRTGASSGTGSA